MLRYFSRIRSVIRSSEVARPLVASKMDIPNFYNVAHEYQGLLRPEEDTLATGLKHLGLQNVYSVLYSVLSAGLGQCFPCICVEQPRDPRNYSSNAYLNAVYAINYESRTMLRSDCCVVTPRCFPLAGRMLCCRGIRPPLKDDRILFQSSLSSTALLGAPKGPKNCKKEEWNI